MYAGIFKHQKIIPKYEKLMVALCVCTRHIQVIIQPCTSIYRHMTVYDGICRDIHDVLVLIPKNTTNLKCSLNWNKIRCTNVVPNASIWQCTVGDTLCRQSSTEIEFGQTGRLARDWASGDLWQKGTHSQDLVFGNSKKFARASHSLQKQNAPFIELEH